MRFAVILFTTGIILAASLYGLVVAVDPYNKLGNNPFGFQTKAVAFARENKFNQVEFGKKAYTAFVLGSSSAHRYETKKINELTGLVSYNYSTQSATPEDYIAMTRHILSKYKPKLLLISFDFEAFRTKTKTNDMLLASPLKKYLTDLPPEELKTSWLNDDYLNLEAVGYTFRVIWVNLFGKATHAYLEDGDHEVEKSPKQLEFRQFPYNDYVFDQKRIELMKKLKKMCDDNGVRIIAFNSPVSLEHYQAILNEPGLPAIHQQYVDMVLDIFGEFWEFHHPSIAKYNSLRYFRDTIHPTHEFSSIILERMLSDKHPELGVLLKR